MYCIRFLKLKLFTYIKYFFKIDITVNFILHYFLLSNSIIVMYTSEIFKFHWFLIFYVSILGMANPSFKVTYSHQYFLNIEYVVNSGPKIHEECKYVFEKKSFKKD